MVTDYEYIRVYSYILHLHGISHYLCITWRSLDDGLFRPQHVVNWWIKNIYLCDCNTFILTSDLFESVTTKWAESFFENSSIPQHWFLNNQWLIIQSHSFDRNYFSFLVKRQLFRMCFIRLDSLLEPLCPAISWVRGVELNFQNLKVFFIWQVRIWLLIAYHFFLFTYKIVSCV
jgi:hypothetical protein